MRKSIYLARLKSNLVLLMGLLLPLGQLYAVCMTQFDANQYGCVAMEDPKGEAKRYCDYAHGSEYYPFYTDNYCSLELAHQLRNQKLETSKDLSDRTVEAACMSYEQGMQRGCEYYDFEAAHRYCSERFGNKYLPFIPDRKNCSLESASMARGEVDGSVLVEGLASEMDEIEAIMTMIDKEGLNDPLAGLRDLRPAIGNEFYTDVVKVLMAKMNTFKNRLYENAKHNVSIQDPKTVEYLRYAFRYLGVLSRLYKVYAYVAHENHVALKSYDFKNLEYLDLVLKKEYALEVLSQVNFRVETINEGKDLRFSLGQQERQTLEYLSLQSPQTKTDYAKLISFMGIRENLTNLWGVARMTPKNLVKDDINSCSGFLSFRSREGSMTQSDAYHELFEYDVFYNDYVNRWDALVEYSQNLAIMDEGRIYRLEKLLARELPEFRSLLGYRFNTQNVTDAHIHQAASEDAALFVAAENETWKQFSYSHFSTIVMPGDNVTNPEEILWRISEEAYVKRMQALIDAFLASNPWMSDTALAKARELIKSYAKENLQFEYMARVQDALRPAMENYNSTRDLARKNRLQKITETYEIAKKAVVAVNVLDAIENKNLDFKRMNTLEPSSAQELMFLFQSRLEQGFEDVRQTLETNREMAQMINGFFEDVSNEYESRYLRLVDGKKEWTGGLTERVKALREISYSKARELFEKHPYEIKTQRTRSFLFWNEERTDTIPVYDNNIPVTLDNKTFLAASDCQTPLPMQLPEFNASLYFGATNPLEVGLDRERGSRDNPDRLGTQKIERPLEVVNSDVSITRPGQVYIAQSRLEGLYESFQILNAQSKEELQRKREQEKDSQVARARHLAISHPARFLARALKVLNLEQVGMVDRSYGRFAGYKEAQEILAKNIVSQAYQSAALLRNEMEWTVNGETKNVSLLERIALGEYDRSNNVLDEGNSIRLINASIDDAVENIQGKLETFCSANFIDYQNDDDFAKVYAASKYARSTLKSAMGQSERSLDKIKKFDEQVRKELRGKMQAMNEDYFEPALLVLGSAAIISLGVVLVIGSGGVAAPGIASGFYALASSVMAVEFFVSFPLVMGSLYSRINTHFIEVPAQLKFQQSLAVSQVGYGKTIDWDMLDENRKENLSSKRWTIGLMPLDLFYGAALARHVQKEAGFVGRAAFERLTGTRLRRGWSAPVATLADNPGLMRLRQEQASVAKSYLQRGVESLARFKSMLPKYQALPQGMISSGALRYGILRKARALGIESAPWELMDEMQAHTARLRSKLLQYDEYVRFDGEMVRKVRLNRALRPGEVMNNFKQSWIYFLPKALIDKLKTDDIAGITMFVREFGQTWEKMKVAQGIVIDQRVRKLESVTNKLSETKRAMRDNGSDEQSAFELFLSRLSDDEVLMLEEVSKASNGIMSEFKRLFKDHRHVVHGLRPMSELNFSSQMPQGAYEQMYHFDGRIHEDYVFESDAQDLLEFYQSMIKNNAFDTPEMRHAHEAVLRSIDSDSHRLVD